MVVSSIQASLIYYEVRAMHSSSDRAVGKQVILVNFSPVGVYIPKPVATPNVFGLKESICVAEPLASPFANIFTSLPFQRITYFVLF